ncbi:adenylyltransferase/cytidyltransferase family protein [Arthrobacter psychrochitiniphilus]|uniref:adenylyltransferase/cytidyltransferase family protein n=1 Tax=Arthrobacter psychrochitiniphilus TaxID=291045 RepID=UPI003F7B9938
MVQRIGYAAGAYDLFHIGHLNILKHAKTQCDWLIAGVVSDELCESSKGRRPVVPLIERLAIVQSIKYVDEAVAEVLPDKLATWERLKFDIFFKGDDWRGTSKGRDLESRFAMVGVEVVYFPYTVNTSSTQLRMALSIMNAEKLRANH